MISRKATPLSGMAPRLFKEQHIQTGQLPPVVLFSGPEDYWKEMHLDILRQKVLQGNQEALSSFRYRTGDVPVRNVLEEAESMGFFGARKVITYGDVNSLNSEEQAALAAYAASPNPETVLVLETIKIDKRLPIGKALAKKILPEVDYSLNNLKETLDEFLAHKTEALGGMTFSGELVAFLHRNFHENLRQLSHMLDQAAARSGYQGPLETSQFLLRNPSALGAKFEAFQFADLVLQKKAAAALAMVPSLMTQMDSIFQTLGLLRSRFQLALRVLPALKNRASAQEIAASCNAHPYAVKMLLPLLRQASFADLNRRYQLIAECDYTLKSSAIPTEHQFAMLIYRLCR